jgi:hypothetical protein
MKKRRFIERMRVIWKKSRRQKQGDLKSIRPAKPDKTASG